MSEKIRRTPEENLTKAIFDKYPDYLEANGRTLRSVVWQVLEDLPKRAVSHYRVKTPDNIQKIVILYRFGLAGGKSKSLKEIADLFGITKERIRQYEDKAMRQLRHPSRSNKLRCFFESAPDQEIIRDEEELTEAFNKVASRYPRTYKRSPNPPFREIAVLHLPTLVWNVLVRNGISRLSQVKEVVETDRPLRGIGKQGREILQETLREAEKKAPP